jgi:hypothetical protein
MWDDERSAGVALRALYDEPAPPPVTTLEDVVRRGRRRVRTQRLSVLALVLVLVAVAGGGLVWFRSLTVDPPATDPLLATNAMPWPEDLPGWSLVSETSCEAPELAPVASTAPALSKDVLEPAFAGGVSVVSGTTPFLWMSHWNDPSRVDVAVEVPVDTATANVYFEATTTTVAVPVAAADIEVWAFGPPCAVPMRRIMASGAVMQLYAPDTRSPFAPIQRLRAYLPGGRVYMVTSAGWGRADLNAGVVSSGRGRLPLDGRQLADVATRLIDTS